MPAPSLRQEEILGGAVTLLHSSASAVSIQLHPGGSEARSEIFQRYLTAASAPTAASASTMAATGSRWTWSHPAAAGRALGSRACASPHGRHQQQGQPGPPPAHPGPISLCGGREAQGPHPRCPPRWAPHPNWLTYLGKGALGDGVLHHLPAWEWKGRGRYGWPCWTTLVLTWPQSG